MIPIEISRLRIPGGKGSLQKWPVLLMGLDFGLRPRVVHRIREWIIRRRHDVIKHYAKQGQVCRSLRTSSAFWCFVGFNFSLLEGRKNMNYKISFQEMERLGKEKLSNQLPATLEEKRKQFQDLKVKSSSGNRKRKS